VDIGTAAIAVMVTFLDKASMLEMIELADGFIAVLGQLDTGILELERASKQCKRYGEIVGNLEEPRGLF